jgi:hypothetical protein
MVDISLSGSGEGPGATQRPGLLDTLDVHLGKVAQDNEII